MQDGDSDAALTLVPFEDTPGSPPAICMRWQNADGAPGFTSGDRIYWLFGGCGTVVKVGDFRWMSIPLGPPGYSYVAADDPDVGSAVSATYEAIVPSGTAMERYGFSEELNRLLFECIPPPGAIGEIDECDVWFEVGPSAASIGGGSAHTGVAVGPVGFTVVCARGDAPFGLGSPLYFSTMQGGECSGTEELPPTVPLDPWIRAGPGIGEVELFWSEPERGPVDEYHIYRGTSSDNLSPLAGDLEPLVPIPPCSPCTSFRDSGLQEATKYFYRIAAANEVGEGPLTDLLNATTFGRPDAPENLTAEAGPWAGNVSAAGNISLAWSPPVDDGGEAITAYTVYRAAQGAPLGFLASLGPGYHGFLDSGLPNGSTWTYVVTASNLVGEGPGSNPATATTFDVPGPPVNLTGTASRGVATLEWNPPASDGGLPILNYTLHIQSEFGNESMVLGPEARNYIHDACPSTCNYTASASNALGHGPESNPLELVVWARETVLPLIGFEIPIVPLPPESTPGVETPDAPGTEPKQVPDIPGTNATDLPPTSVSVRVTNREDGAPCLSLYVTILGESVQIPISQICPLPSSSLWNGLVPRGNNTAEIDPGALAPTETPDHPGSPPFPVPDIPAVEAGDLGSTPLFAISLRAWYSYDPSQIGAGSSVGDYMTCQPFAVENDDIEWILAHGNQTGFHVEIAIHSGDGNTDVRQIIVPWLGQLLGWGEALESQSCAR